MTSDALNDCIIHCTAGSKASRAIELDMMEQSELNKMIKRLRTMRDDRLLIAIKHKTKVL